MPSLETQRRSPRSVDDGEAPPPLSAFRAEFRGKPIKMRRVGALVLDESLRGVPLGFVRHTLRTKGPELLESAMQVSVVDDRSGFTCSRSTVVRCVLPSATTPRPWKRQRVEDDRVDSPLPTHVLAVTFQDDPRGRLVPIHGLCWALEVPSLAAASRASPPHADLALRDHRHGEFDLPVLALRLPHARAFPILHEWIYCESPVALLQHLLVSPTPPSLSPGHLPTGAPRFASSSAEIMDRLYLLHTVRETAVAMELSSAALWEVLALGWDRLVVAGAAARVRERPV